MNALDQYHVGIVVDDFDSATDWLAKNAGYRWCEEMTVKNLFVTPVGETPISLRLTYSRDEPHLEVIEAIPDSIFTSSEPSLHHLGYWSDDVEADLAALEAEGATIDGRGFWPDGKGPIWAFATPPIGPRIELVHRSSKGSMEQWWATGVRGG